MAAPSRNHSPQCYNQNVRFRPRFDAQGEGIPRHGFQSFNPRYQDRFGGPRPRFENQNWNGNTNPPALTDFQHPPPTRPYGQGFFSPPPNTSNVLEQGHMNFQQNTVPQENPSMPPLPKDQYSSGNLLNSNSQFNATNLQNSSGPNFQNTGFQTPPSFRMPQQNAMLPVPMQFAMPPPPLPRPQMLPPSFEMSSPPVHETKEATDDTNSGKQRLDGWLRKRQKGNKDPQVKDLCPDDAPTSIHAMQCKMRRMMLLMAQLQQETNTLTDLGTAASDEAWNDQKHKVTNLKSELEKIHEELSDEKNIDKVKEKVMRQRKKRERLKRRRQEIYEEKQRAEDHRNKLHAEIDAWQAEIQKKETEKRESKELKKSADAILNEVRKKINDVTKSMDLLKGIQKLRKLRSDRLKQQGVHTNPASDEKFKEVMDEQFDTMKKQKEIYLAEEKALKVMLETEHEENKEKEREQQQKVNKMKQERENRKTEEILFGKSEYPSENNPMLPFLQYYDQANYNYDSFIQTRYDWDRFVVPDHTPGGSRIPNHFVTPTEPSSEKWASVLKDS
ncbi:uncharacterized protein LOC111130466 [Crassostrea virginica]